MNVQSKIIICVLVCFGGVFSQERSRTQLITKAADNIYTVAYHFLQSAPESNRI